MAVETKELKRVLPVTESQADTALLLLTLCGLVQFNPPGKRRPVNPF